jgi:hypothetical protein
MTLYHGSPYLFDAFRTPANGGPIRECEAERQTFRDVVFLTTDRKYALQYAQAEGVLYEVECPVAREYRALAAKKKKRGKSGKGYVGAHIYVARPDECKITSRQRMLPRRRGESQRFVAV